jgi:glycosyltransferase involved in cell wall biosynthesis
VTVEPRQVPGLVAAARRLGVEGAFDFLGYVARERVRPLMEGALAVVLPAKLETFGLPYFEAMNAGVPVVAADRECAREACGDAALYASADSGRAFADHVLQLAASPAARDALVEAGRRRYQEVRRTWAHVAQAYWDALARLTGAGLSRRGAVG